MDSYLGDPVFDKKRLFSDQRYPNVVVSKKGTVIAVWGNSGVAIRRSEDGGKSWGEPINVSEKGYNGGGAIVDNGSGNVILKVKSNRFRSEWKKLLIKSSIFFFIFFL